ncbi:hypothetical protein IQ272_15465, partial [Chroococcidiopsidales cyanobacterium LEGE 13417]|nr:hypothetical protein [Chroococcidiopsidales cyanobacterium LEGE 13417]
MTSDQLVLTFDFYLLTYQLTITNYLSSLFEYSMRSIFSSRPERMSSIGDLHCGQAYCSPI